jgi:hypothetical protein
MALKKAFPSDRNYDFWNILLCYLISQDMSLAEKDRTLFGMLAYRLTSKAAADVPTTQVRTFSSPSTSTPDSVFEAITKPEPFNAHSNRISLHIRPKPSRPLRKLHWQYMFYKIPATLKKPSIYCMDPSWDSNRKSAVKILSSSSHCCCKYWRRLRVGHRRSTCVKTCS